MERPRGQVDVLSERQSRHADGDGAGARGELDVVSAVVVQGLRVAGPSTQGVGGDDATGEVDAILQG